MKAWLTRERWKQMVASAPRAELEQSLLRFGLVGAAYAYLLFHTLKDWQLDPAEQQLVWVGAAFFAMSINFLAVSRFPP